MAASVADGEPVDWGNVETEIPQSDRRLLRHLRLVESIATLYRTLPAESADEADATLREPSGPRWGPLVLMDRIGQGASGKVHRAWDPALRRYVALKLFDEAGDRAREAHSRVLEEARRLARLRHENVVHVYGAEEHQGQVGLWMELVPGDSLETFVRTHGPFGASEAAEIGRQLCSAVAAVHAAGLLHRDIKAQNVLREAGGRVVLMDFGTGEPLRRNAGTARMVGTPLYLAPELFRGQPASVQSDLYAIGVLLFHLVTGEFPVTAGSMEQLARAHAKREVRRLRDRTPRAPDAFARAVDRALDPDPGNRYRTAEDFAAALREIEPVASAEPRISKSQRVPLLGWAGIFPAIAAAVLILAALLAGWSRAAATLPITRVAIMPLAPSANDPEAGAFASALTDELSSALGQSGALQVRAGISVREYQAQSRPLEEIARALSVDALVQGSVLPARRTDDVERLRVNLRVIAAGSAGPFWSRTFERPRGDLELLKADIVTALGGALKFTHDTAHIQALRSRHTTPAAEDAYLRGRIHLTNYGPEPARLARDAFLRAIELDPTYSPAYAGLGRAYITLGLQGGMAHPDARGSALAAARKALELDESLPDAHAILAEIHFFYDWDWAGAEREFRRSLELNPNYTYARVYYAQFLAAIKRFDEAYAEALTARAHDPESADARTLPALVQYYRGDFEAAEAEVHSQNSVVLVRIRESQGRLDEALELARRTTGGMTAPLGVPLRVILIRLLALTNHPEEAAAEVRALERDSQTRIVRLTSRDRGYIRLALGDIDGALTSFEDALEQRDPSLVWFGVDHRLNPLRNHQRFQQLLQRINLQ